MPDDLERIRQEVERLAPGWRVSARFRSEPSDEYVEIQLDHPGSAGLILGIKRDEPNWTASAQRMLTNPTSQRELAVVEAAPELEHPTAVMGVRNLAQAFRWDRKQVQGVAFLLYEVEAVNADEAAWLAGYVGTDAPMAPISPLEPG